VFTAVRNRWARAGALWEVIAPGTDADAASALRGGASASTNGGSVGSVVVGGGGGNDGSGDNGGALALPPLPVVHRLSPLDAVHRTMAAVACLDLRYSATVGDQSPASFHLRPWQS